MRHCCIAHRNVPNQITCVRCGQRERDGGGPIPTDHDCASFVALNRSFIFIARVGTRDRLYVRTKDGLCFRNVNSDHMNVSGVLDYLFLQVTQKKDENFLLTYSSNSSGSWSAVTVPTYCSGRWQIFCRQKVFTVLPGRPVVHLRYDAAYQPPATPL